MGGIFDFLCIATESVAALCTVSTSSPAAQWELAALLESAELVEFVWSVQCDVQDVQTPPSPHWDDPFSTTVLSLPFCCHATSTLRSRLSPSVSVFVFFAAHLGAGTVATLSSGWRSVRSVSISLLI